MNRTLEKSFGLNSAQGIREKQIRIFTQDLLSVEGNNEDTLWRLSLYSRKDDIKAVKHYLTRSLEVQGLYWFVQYLASIETQDGILELFNLIDHENKAVREVACLGIVKVAQDIQMEFLIRKLDSSYQDVVCFAAAQLAKNKNPLAVEALIKAFKKTMDGQVQLAIIEALGQLKDERSLPFLEEVSGLENKRLRETALWAISQMAIEGNRSLIYKCMASSNYKVREAVYLTILKQPTRFSEQFIVEALEEEPEQQLKVRVLAAIRGVKTKSLLKAILNLATDGEPKHLRNLARAVLKRGRSDLVFKGLWQAFKRATAGRKHVLLRLLTDYSEYAQVRGLLKHIVLYTRDPVQKFIVIDAMGKYKLAEYKNVLLRIMEEGNHYSFAAVTAYLNSNPLDWPFMLKYLKARNKRQLPLRHCVLNHILSLQGDFHLPIEIRDQIRTFLKAETLTLRYLAIRCLARFKEESVVEDLWGAYRTENEQSIRHALAVEITQIFKKNIQQLVQFLQMVWGKEKFFGILLKIFRQMTISSRGDLAAVAQKLVELVDYLKKPKKSFRLLDELRLMSLLRCLIRKQPVLFVGILATGHFSDRQLFTLLRALNFSRDALAAGDYNFDFMARLYQTASRDTRREFLKFFSAHKNKSGLMEDVIFRALVVEEDGLLREETANVFQGWLSRSMTAEKIF